MKEDIINIILSIPGLGTIEHVQRSGIDMDDIELAVDEIMNLQFRQAYNKAIDDCITKLSSTTQVTKLLNELKNEVNHTSGNRYEFCMTPEEKELKEIIKELLRAIYHGEMELRITYQRHTPYKGGSSLWLMQEMLEKYKSYRNEIYPGL